eukprot:Plantae.Rhodophyta-Purpureofilum_apyrenoidigerum.ctg32680.p1 GENE.Plantae.Rhodophyta-Purpureofilum_apyrenoidigerum.ctg32680~~Plantae.Rhodophyta-Purpureofilum_apyrenoidigerum.ctg32680.p1  ORF type:complete len:297 (+),score=38.35 Plantae.Rhodophyta-Purpureofilum_apyrenoidigerum.ctg32680:42-932(+)
MLEGYVWASGADVLRAAQKDREYVAELTKAMEEMMKSVLPPRVLTHRLLQGTRAISTLLYYTGTTLVGRQTLGEEYCDLFEVDARVEGRYAPSFWSRLVMSFAHAAGLNFVRAVVQALTRIYGLLVRDEPLNAFIGWLERVHLALFYLSSRYYELPKRLGAIRFLRVAAVKRLHPRYYLLGVLLSVQVTVSALLYVHKRIAMAASKRQLPASRKSIFEKISTTEEEAEGADTEQESSDNSAKICSLCLSRLKDPALTECGHVFCWSCVAEWLASEDLCPLCRQGIELRGLLCLYQY